MSRNSWDPLPERRPGLLDLRALDRGLDAALARRGIRKLTHEEKKARMFARSAAERKRKAAEAREAQPPSPAPTPPTA